MPSKSLAALPQTANPTALFAQTALPQQILTPLFSFTSTLLLHFFAVCGKSWRFFSTACALFTENAGVYPPSHSPISISHFPFSNVFRINTYKTAICKLFRMNTYEKTREGGRSRWPATIYARRFRGRHLPRLKPAASRTSGPATPAARPSAHSTAGSDPSSYAPYGAPAIPTLRASETRRCHPRRDANRIAGSRLPSASAPPAREAPPPETAHAPCARASTQSTSRHSSAASRDDSPRSLSASFYFFGQPSLLSSLPSRRGLYPKSPRWQAILHLCGQSLCLKRSL